MRPREVKTNAADALRALKAENEALKAENEALKCCMEIVKNDNGELRSVIKLYEEAAYGDDIDKIGSALDMQISPFEQQIISLLSSLSYSENKHNMLKKDFDKMHNRLKSLQDSHEQCAHYKSRCEYYESQTSVTIKPVPRKIHAMRRKTQKDGDKS